MVSSLLLHNVHLLFYCVLSIFALTWLVVTALFCSVMDLFCKVSSSIIHIYVCNWINQINICNPQSVGSSIFNEH